MSELGELSGKAKQILEEYENSKEYKRFQELTKAISRDEEINRLCSILNELQAICRTKESDLLEKRDTLKEIEKIKAELYSKPLWINYITARDELERLKNEVIESLDEKLG